MFIDHELTLDTGFPAARARLARLAHGDGLSCVSQDAYHSGLAAATVRVGPFGAVPGASKRVRIRCLEPVFRPGTMTVGLRWEAIGMAGALFPVMDADISLTAAGEHTTRMSLAGAYRPPLGPLGAGLDKAILHQVASATVRALLRDLGSMLTGTAQHSATEDVPPSAAKFE
jgi:hypothetical protein